MLRANIGDSHPPWHVANMYAATTHGLWPIELNAWIMPSENGQISYCQCWVHNMHTQARDGKVQFAVTVTLTPATTKAEKKNKDTSGGATGRIRVDISCPKVRVV